MKNKIIIALRNTRRFVRGFSLIEMITVLMLTAMILAATIMIYGKIRISAAAVNARLDSHNLGEEVLQKIAEDIDRLASPGFDTTIAVHNKNENGYNSAQLVIQNSLYGNGNPPVQTVYERIIWQSMYFPDEDRLILYRLHGGINIEDKIVVQTPPDNKPLPELYVPVCDGLTHFQIQAMTDSQQAQDTWQGQGMPKGLLLSISAAPLMQLEDGSYYLPEEMIVSRSVAVDRTREIAYTFVPRSFDDTDPNQLDVKDPNEKTADKAAAPGTKDAGSVQDKKESQSASRDTAAEKSQAPTPSRRGSQ